MELLERQQINYIGIVNVAAVEVGDGRSEVRKLGMKGLQDHIAYILLALSVTTTETAFVGLDQSGM